MNIVMFYPGAKLPGFASLKAGGSNEAVYANHGLMAISAVLKDAGHTVTLMDLRGFQSFDHFEGVVAKTDYDVVLVSFYSCDAEYAKTMCELAKKRHPGRPIIAGGVHVSVTRIDDFPNVDCIVHGEGDLVIDNLVKTIKVRKGKEKPLVVTGDPVLDLDTLPFADRDLFNMGFEEQTPLLPALPTPFKTIVFGRGCPHKCMFCFVPGTLVLTSNGMNTIENVNVGDHVLSHNGDFNRVSRKFSRPYSGEIVTITPRFLGIPISSTPDHKLLVVKRKRNVGCKYRWKTAKSIKNGDYLSVPIELSVFSGTIDLWKIACDTISPIRVYKNKMKLKYTHLYPQVTKLVNSGWSVKKTAEKLGISRNTVKRFVDRGLKQNEETDKPSLKCDDGEFFSVANHSRGRIIPCVIKVDNDLMRLLGYYAAEGHTSCSNGRPSSYSVTFTISVKEDKLKNDIMRLLDRYGEPHCCTNESNNTYQISVSSVELYLIVTHCIGCGAENKNVSSVIMKQPPELQREFLYGYFLGDGNINSNTLSVTSVSPSLILDVWKIGVRCGIIGSIDKRNGGKSKILGRDVDTKDSFRVRWNRKRFDSKESILELCGNIDTKNTEVYVDYVKSRVCVMVDRVEREAYNGFVYNMSVDRTETYNVFGFGVHNCAPSRELIFTKRCRIRSVDHIVHELAGWGLGTASGGTEIGSLMIHDDLIAKKKWCLEFAERFGSTIGPTPLWIQTRADFVCKNPDVIEALREVGLSWASVGFESGNQRMLDFLDKGTTVEMNLEAADILQRNGVNLFANMIMGLPTETEDDRQATLRMLEKIKPAWHSMSMYTLYPGSYMYKYVIDNDLATDEHYSMIRYPYERKIKDVDYDRVYTCMSEAANHKRPIVEFKPKTQVSMAVAEEELASVVDFTLDVSPLRFPKYTVITATYNRPDFLEEAIQSVRDQTETDWEMIIVDNCSTDRRAIEVMRKAAIDRRITIIRNTADFNNIAYSWNRALTMATGKYVCFLDNDNRKLPDFLEVLGRKLDSDSELMMVAGQNQMMDGSGNVLNSFHANAHEVNKNNILKKNYIDSGEMLIRRETFDLIGYFDERCVTREDWDWVVRFIYSGFKYDFVKRVTALYRMHATNRMRVSNYLGNAASGEIIRTKKRSHTMDVMFVTPEMSKLTLSQTQVINGVYSTLTELPFVFAEGIELEELAKRDLSKLKFDVALFIAPFEMKEETLKAVSGIDATKVAMLIEDPQATGINLKRLPYFDWVVTNDLSSTVYYTTMLEKCFINGHKHVLCMPSLSVDDTRVKASKKDRTIDVLVLGYAYDSRKKFVSDVLSSDFQFNMTLVGDGWNVKDKRITVLPTRTVEDTFDLMCESKIVVCLNRERTDLGGNSRSVSPVCLHRGYMEAYSGAAIMTTRRSIKSFADGDIVEFDSPAEFMKEVKSLLKNSKKRKEMAKKSKRRADYVFTYKTRINELLNCVRSERHNVVIP